MRVLNRFLTVAVCVTTVVAAAAQGGAPPNTLTPAEKAAGWTLLFDGRTTAGWRGFHSETFPAAGWAAENGAIKTVGARARAAATSSRSDSSTTSSSSSSGRSGQAATPA